MGRYRSALTLVVCLASASVLHAQEIIKPLGKWERKVGKTHVTLGIEDNRLHINCTGDKSVTLHADYAMTRDGLIYGVVTSIECDDDEETDISRTLFDAPFSFRFRIDEAALIIHEMKAHDADSKDDMWNGRYRAVQPATTQTAIMAPLSGGMPSYVTQSVTTPNMPPPCPIAPSFISPKDGESKPAKTSKEPEKVFNFWMGFIR
jgi:hypothetical protein